MAASRHVSLGIQVAMTMIICVAAGLLADRRLGTEPWMLVSGAFSGIVFVLVRLLYVAGVFRSDRK